MNPNEGTKADMPDQSKRGRSRFLRIGMLGCVVVAIIVLTPVFLLVENNGQYQAGEWGVRWLPANHPWVGQAHGIRVMEEGVTSGLGGQSTSNGTYMTQPAGLVHTQLKQWGRLQWWRAQVVKEPGKYSQSDVKALTQEMMQRLIQRAGNSTKQNKPTK
jgi:hypothetical protein